MNVLHFLYQISELFRINNESVMNTSQVNNQSSKKGNSLISSF